VITTSAGSDVLAAAGATKLSSLQIHVLDAESGTMAPMAMLRFLYAELGVRRLLHEGGPTLFGQFLAVEAVDELFLTLSPQIAGRKGDTIRPGLVEGIEFMPDRSPGFNCSASSKGLSICTYATGVPAATRRWLRARLTLQEQPVK
jgi:riboflavin biosynthesis pyrimidine reductase